MSIVSTSNRWLNRLYKTVAILLVLLAVLISAFRLLLPYVHHYRLPLQNYLNEQSQTNISIGTLSMTWEDFGPSLVIGDVKIFDNKNSSILIEKLELQIDFWKTITQQQFISKNLILSRAQVDISEQLLQRKKENNVVNSEVDANKKNNIRVISDLLLNRINHFSILDSEMSIKNDSITRSVRINKLRWLNTKDRHQAQGSVVLNGLSSNNLQLKIDLKGKTINELTGQAYLQANHIDITPWLDNVLVLEDDKTKTDINFSAWFAVDDSHINSLKVDFSDSNMLWSYNDKKQQLTLDNGQFLLIKGEQESSFNLYSTPLTLKLNDQPSQYFTAMLENKKESFSWHISEIDLAMLAELAPLIVAKKETRKLLSEMSLSGKVEDLYIRHNNNKLQVTANLSGINNNYSSGIPSLENVSGQVSFVDDYLAIKFKAEKGQLTFDKLFVQAFPYESLSGQLSIGFDNDGWTLTVDNFDFLSKEINLSAQIKAEKVINGEVQLALLANVSNTNAGLVGRYLPLPIMSKNLVNYLNLAVVSGRVENAQILINGPIKRFPFTDGSGTFVVDAELSKSEFKFVKSWPAITDFTANLNFTNNTMLITGRGGELTGLDVTGASVGIADLANGKTLTVDATIKPTAVSHISNLMNKSPLKGSVGSVLDQLQLTGEVSGDFYLSLPLSKNGQPLASGSLLFDNNKASLQVPRMDFSDIQGTLNFSNDKISTQDLQLTWQGLPIALDITGMNKDDYYDTNIKLTALWQAPEWLVYVPPKLQEYTQGELPWLGELSLYQHHQGGFSYDAEFNADLTQEQLLLPFSYDHNIKQKNKLSVKINGTATQSKVLLNYGDNIHFSGLLNHKRSVFSHANLMLGEGSMTLPMEGFHITTKLDYADFSLWQPLISNIIDSVNDVSLGTEEDEANPFLAKPERIRGSIGQLKILGQHLNNVSFNLLDKSQWWLLQLNATETRSQIKFYPDWLVQGVDMNAEFLNLPTNEEINSIASTQQQDETEKESFFYTIPAIKFHCDSCIFGLLDLGQVDVTVSRIDHQTVAFSNLTAKRDKTQLTLNGRWIHNEQESKTFVEGKLLIDDIETEMEAFSYDSIFKDSGADVNFKLNWLGGFHAFDISQLNGSYKTRIDDGYLAEVPDKARLFSVLSLQSLVRKLTFDFRDIFSDGMFYSNIKGDYQLHQGLLTTSNTEMNGTAGNMFMTGYTNLLTGELDYDMSYKPELTSSLPVLAWITTLNPVTFLAGVAIDQVVKSQVVSEFNFKLTGNIDKPNFQEVDRKNKNITVKAEIITGDIKKETPVVEHLPLDKSIITEEDK